MSKQLVSSNILQEATICDWCKSPVDQSEAAWNYWLETDDDLDLHDKCLETIARKEVKRRLVDVVKTS